MKSTNKLTAVAAAVTATLSCAANANVMITEYVEGGSFNKAIELYNAGSSSVDLEGYQLVRYKDGDTEASSMGTISGVTLAAGEVLVVKHSSLTLDDTIKSVDMGLSFNGGDAVGLTDGTNVLDVVGEVPTPSGWAKDVTLQRLPSATAPVTTFDESEWTSLPKDTLTGLGEFGGEVELPEPFSCEGAELTFIHEIQGEGATSPLITEGFASTESFTVKGIVTARGESLQQGFYLQDIEVDGNPATSDGIFVYLGTSAPSTIQPGAEVCVEAKVREFYNHTQLDLAADPTKFEVINAEGEAPAATPFVVNDGETLEAALERHEGMKIVLDAGSEMKVTRPFSFDFDAFRNNMVLSHKTPLYKATQLYPANSEEAMAHEAANRVNELYVESDFKAASGVLPYMPSFNAEDGYIRIGDQLTNLEGTVGYSFGEYRLIVGENEVITAGDIIRGDDRTQAPAIANEGDLRVASFNVLNYFNDSVGGDESALGQNRGTDNQFEFRLQREKIVNAITSMNADIVGLMEIENNGFGENSAIQDLVNALNDELSEEDAYSFIEVADEDKYEEKFFGSDAIMVGILYRAAKVTPTGGALVIETPIQDAPEGAAERQNKNDETESSPAYNKFQRFSLAQTFTAEDDNKLTVVVNHFKSKGSECLEDWIGGFEDDDPTDLQGHCNNFRVSAAEAVGKALESVEGDILILGDLNAYGKEDPLLVLTDYPQNAFEGQVIKTAAHTTLNGETLDTEQRIITEGFGYVNLNTELHGADTYSYSYSGELGNLDHALANASLTEKVVAIEDWHINAVESNMFEYSSRYTGDLVKSGNAFSSSDHDPVLIAIDFPDAPAPTPAPTPEPTPEPESSNGGSLGFMSLALLSLIGLRRRRA